MSELGGESSSIIQSKIGRFPVWLVGLVLAALVIGFLWWKRRGTKSAPSADPLAVNDQAAYYDGSQDGVSGLPPGAIGGYLDQSPLDSAYPVGLTPSGIPGPITNVQWARLAQDWLLGQGNDPALVERALAKYVQGLALNTQEQAVINIAQRTFGSPPEGPILVPQTPDTPVTPPPTGTTPQTPTPTAPAARRSVVVARYTSSNPPWNSTLSGIASRYGTTVARLSQINNISNPNFIRTGQTIWIDP
jgi:LysM repeat protein